MEHLVGEASFRPGTDTRLIDELMSSDHGEVLEAVLEDQILTLGEPAAEFKGDEGDEGLEKAFFETTGTGPFPQVGVFRM
jgi:hypothetical protein